MKRLNLLRISVLLLVLLTTSLSVSAQDRLKTITVSGSAKVSVEIEYIEMSFRVVSRNVSYEKAQAENLKISESVIKQLASTYKLKSEDIYTNDYRLGDYYTENAQGKSVKASYEASTTMKINVRNLASYKEILIGIMNLGISNIDSISWVPKDLGPYRVEALKLAYQSAEKKAKEIALVAGAKLKGISSFSEQASSGNYNMRSYNNVVQSSYYGETESGDSSVISQGNRTISAEVLVVFEIE